MGTWLLSIRESDGEAKEASLRRQTRLRDFDEAGGGFKAVLTNAASEDFADIRLYSFKS